MSTNTQVAKQDQKRDIRTYIQSDTVKQQLAMVLPKHITADRMARVVCTAIIKTPKLLDCTPESLLQAMMLCSQAGLEPDGRNAHLIPYGNVCTVIFDYKGLISIAERNGVQGIYADKVCENDEFSARVENGVKRLDHRIDWKKPRGTPYAYYCSCIRSERLDYEVMTKDEVDAIRKRSKASGSGPWVTDYDEMAKKTTLRRMSKRWDLSPELADAINADDDVPNFGKVKTPVFDGPELQVQTEQVAADVSEAAATDQRGGEGAVPADKKLEPTIASDVISSTDTGKLAHNIANPYEHLAVMVKESGVTEPQVLVVLKAKKMCNPTCDDLAMVADSKLLEVIKAWVTILPEVRAVKV